MEIQLRCTHALRFECELLRKSPAMLLFYSVRSVPVPAIKSRIHLTIKSLWFAITIQHAAVQNKNQLNSANVFISQDEHCNESAQTHPSKHQP